jgi:hypothetical protein
VKQPTRAHRLWILVLAGLLLAPATPVRAALVVTDRAGFEALSTNLQIISFEGLAPPSSFTFFGSPPGLTVQGVNFQGVGNALFVIDPLFNPPAFFFPSGQFLENNSGNFVAPINVTLPAGVTAIGSDFSAQNVGLFDYTVTLSTGEVFNLSASGRPTLSFVGILSDVPVASISFNARNQTTGGAMVLDNFTFGQAIPEPGAFCLMSVGAIGLLGGLLRRWRLSTA